MSLFDLLVGLTIFGYASYTLYRFTRKAKSGKCATCEIEPTCTTKCDASDWNAVIKQALQSDRTK